MKKVLLACVCAITRLKGVILIGESLLYCLVQEPSSYVVPGLRYEGKYKSHSIIGTVHYMVADIICAIAAACGEYTKWQNLVI